VAFLSRDVLTDYLASGRLVAHHVPGFSHQRERALIINHTAIFAGPLRDFVSTVFAHFSLDMPESIVTGSARAQIATTHR
jgi:hypothetical protein